MFHYSHSIHNFAFCWNSSTFCWHNFFSVNIKCYTEVDQQKFVEKIRNGSHVLYQYTMCYMKCKAGELRDTSLQYSFENTIFTLKIMPIRVDFMQKFYSHLENFCYESVQYIMHPIRLILAERQGDVMPWRCK
jgi:hypothetical protein